MHARSKMDLGDLLFLVMGFWCGPTLALICPPDWHRYGESCYVVITRRMNWHAANRTCGESQANLVVPNSKLENNFIWELFLQTFDQDNTSKSLWIGCNDIEEEGNWQNCPLNDDETDAYKNWKEGEPDDKNDTDCAIIKMNSHWKSKWIGIQCRNKRFPTCERPVNTATPLFCIQTGDDGRLITQCLFRHVMKELPGMGVISCGKACRSEPRCRSFNLLEQGGGKMVCQLNNATRHEAAEGDMKEEKENCYFYDL